MTPSDFRDMKGFKEGAELARISRQHYGHQTIIDLKKAAEKSIGIPLENDSYTAERITMNL